MVRSPGPAPRPLFSARRARNETPRSFLLPHVRLLLLVPPRAAAGVAAEGGGAPPPGLPHVGAGGEEEPRAEPRAVLRLGPGGREGERDGTLVHRLPSVNMTGGVGHISACRGGGSVTSAHVTAGAAICADVTDSPPTPHWAGVPNQITSWSLAPGTRSGSAHFFDRLPTENMASPTGQAW